LQPDTLIEDTLIRSSRHIWLYVATLLIVAGWLAIRWPHGSLWYDEALTTWVADGPWERLIRWCTQIDIQVPLHYVVLRGWMALLGSSEFALHLLSAFCGLLAVAGLMALVWRLMRSTTVAIVAGLLLGLSPGFVWVAYEVRAYALALALYAWASVLLYDLLKPNPPRRRVVVAYCLLMLAALYTHYTAIGGLAAHIAIVGWVLLTRRSLDILRRAVAAGLMVGVGFTPWLPVLLSRGNADRSFYAGTILPDQTLGVISSFKWLARDDFRWLMPDKAVSPLVPFVAGGLILLAVGTVVWLITQRQKAILPLIYGLSMAIIPAAMIAIVVYFKPKLAGRYAWPSWIGLDLLLAPGIVALARLTSPPVPLSARSEGDYAPKDSLRRLVFPVLVTVVLLALPWLSGQTGHPPDSDFRGAFAYVREHWQPGDLVILRDGTLFPAAEYYHSPQPYIGLPEANLTDATHVLHAAEAVPILSAQADSIRGVWVVSWQDDVMDPEAVIPGLLESIGVRHDSSFGDVSLDYFALNHPLSSLEMPRIGVDPLVAMPEGLTLESAGVVTSGPLRPGDSVIGHTWWQRRGPVSSNARVSIRLYGSDGRVYGQIDQPPAGWVYFPDRWPDRTLILGRYVMQIPPDAAAPLTMKLVVYSAANDVTPVEVTVGTVEVQAAPAG
jgi:mannosyltransferase